MPRSRAHERRPALPIVPRSGHRILNHPEPAFRGLAPLNQEMQDSTDLENLEANVAECGFGGAPRLAGGLEQGCVWGHCLPGGTSRLTAGGALDAALTRDNPRHEMRVFLGCGRWSLVARAE